MGNSQPNFLVIMTEQHRGDSLSCEGHPVLLTPTMDHIAGRGVRFSHAYSSCPVCIPARLSFLKGQFPSTHGIVGYAHKPYGGRSIADEISGAGYQTAWIGRDMHQEPADERCGFDTTILSGLCDPHRPYEKFLERNQPEGGGGYYGSGVMHNDYTARPFHLPDNLHHTNWTVNQAMSWLEHRDKDLPFFLVVSFLAAHPPLIPPACYFDRYIRTGVPEPFIGDWATPPENDGIGMGQSSTRVNLKGEALLSARAGYYGLINHLDDQINRLLNPVTGIQRETGGDTVVIMTSDHGEMLGDHYCWAKSLPYEGAARIPLLISAPERFGIRKGAVIEEPVGLEDIMPTVLEMAELEVPKYVDGKSLLPLLRCEPDAADTWRPFIHIEHGDPRSFHSLTDGKGKYVWFARDGREQFFDLTNDPAECVDIANDPDHIEDVDRWRQLMVGELKGRPEGFTDGENLVSGRPYPNIMG
jgi:arylsulfatase A-like enzyme